MVPGAMFQWEVLDPRGLVEWSTDWFRLDPRGTVIHMDLGRRMAYKGSPKGSPMRPLAIPGRALPSMVGVGNYYETPDT